MGLEMGFVLKKKGRGKNSAHPTRGAYVVYLGPMTRRGNLMEARRASYLGQIVRMKLIQEILFYFIIFSLILSFV